MLAAVLGFPTAWFIATRPPRWRPIWLFVITIPFWTNLVIRTFAIQEVIRNEGLIKQSACAGRASSIARSRCSTPISRSCSA